jgi:GntR family transcriptional regulator
MVIIAQYLTVSNEGGRGQAMAEGGRTRGRRASGDGSQGSVSARERLSERIAALSPGEKLPAEPELAAELDVSRPTLREALRSAEDDGLVVRRPGVGTVKTHLPNLLNDLSLNTGVSDLIRAHGLKPGTQSLTVERRYAEEDEARRLGLRRPARVWVVERVRTADGLPVIASSDVVPETLVDEDDMTPDALGQRSLYGYLSDKGHHVHHGVAYVRPEAADAGLASRLDVKKGALLLRLVQVDYDFGGSPLLLSDEHHLPDAFEFSVSRRGPVEEVRP